MIDRGGSVRKHFLTLAHRGVLFLDEFGEFRREMLQALRQPLEDGTVTIVRSKWSVTYPARFQLVAASNPCPCGNEGQESIVECLCSDSRKAAYRERLSGPVVDRIDLQVDVPRLTKEQIFGAPEGQPSAVVAARVADARLRQRARCDAADVTCNAELPPRDIERVCRLARQATALIEDAVETNGLTARGAHRVARVARTIADLAGENEVVDEIVWEALQYRVLDPRSERPV